MVITLVKQFNEKLTQCCISSYLRVHNLCSNRSEEIVVGAIVESS